MIVWITGQTTSGKTWLGDFLQLYHGWKHVEGDRTLFCESQSESSKNLTKSFFDYWFEYKEAPLELWIDYFQELCDNVYTLLATEPFANIVVTFSTYPRVVRDYIREEVKKKTGQDLIIILLAVSEEEYITRSTKRFLEFAKASDKSPEQVWESNEGMKNTGAFSEENLSKYYITGGFTSGLEPINNKEEKNSYTISTNENHKHVIPEVTKILNLPVVENVNMEAVKQMTTERWKEYNNIVKDKQGR